MAVINKGTAVYVYGIDDGTITNAAITNISVSEEYNNVAEVKNEQGVIIAKRFDDRHKTGTVTMLYTATPAGDIGSGTFVYDGETYFISGINSSRSNGEYAEYTFNIRKTEFVAAADAV